MATSVTLPEALEIAIAKFRKITNSPEAPGCDFKNQQQQLRRAVNEERDGKGLADTIFQTLDCFVDIAGVAADAASTVFPAASACVSGISFLLKTVKTYRHLRLASIQEVIEGLYKRLNLVKKLSVAATRGANQISGELNDELLCIICKFLEICTIYATVKKARSSRNPLSRLKLLARAAIGSDYGICEKIYEIEKSTQEARSLQNDEANEAITSSQSTQAQERDRQHIIDFLPCQEQGYWKTWVNSALGNYRQDFVSEAATWLCEHAAFKNWSNPGTDTRTPVLVIQSPTDGSVGTNQLDQEALSFAMQ
ncbi:hypothetical protein INS49_015559 [Diaporthe citri]|uniref:uncharacterized protein n=1 Tax=Diaporthe citri TaxID=83186 RepID=UPI001C818D36|nr:uncharacterized protein INS49_015559 [Diaporthe citri]KAG6356172.1 hypothetical protein INS49_015559 [Diaporthe citri]